MNYQGVFYDASSHFLNVYKERNIIENQYSFHFYCEKMFCPILFYLWCIYLHIFPVYWFVVFDLY